MLIRFAPWTAQLRAFVRDLPNSLEDFASLPTAVTMQLRISWPAFRIFSLVAGFLPHVFVRS